MGKRLTKARRRILASAGNHGVVQMPYLTGLERVAWRKNAEALEAMGLLQPNAHGDWYITPAGRLALQEAKL